MDSSHIKKNILIVSLNICMYIIFKEHTRGAFIHWAVAKSVGIKK